VKMLGLELQNVDKKVVARAVLRLSATPINNAPPYTEVFAIKNATQNYASGSPEAAFLGYLACAAFKSAVFASSEASYDARTECSKEIPPPQSVRTVLASWQAAVMRYTPPAPKPKKSAPQ
jgi:hypothetical protein